MKVHEQHLLEVQIEKEKEAEECEKEKQRGKRQQSLTLAKEQLEQAAAHVREGGGACLNRSTSFVCMNDMPRKAKCVAL